MSEFKIEADVPLEASYSYGRRGKYPWRQMQVGDSFFASAEDMNPKRATNYTWQAAKSTGFKFAARSVEGGTRIWRIE